MRAGASGRGTHHTRLRSSAGGARRRSRAQSGADLQYELEVTFEEAAFGTEKVISIPRNSECKTCHGSGAKPGTSASKCGQCHGSGEMRFQQGFFSVSRTCNRCGGTGETISDPCTDCSGSGRNRKNIDLAIKIPAGIDTGQRLKLSGEGEPGLRGGPSGDLYVVIQVQDHPFFTREEADITCEVPISFPQAALGAEIDVPTLEGKAKLKIPAGMQSNKILRLKHKGIAKLGGYGRGDQLVRVLVETPQKLSAEQKELLRRFQELSDEKSHPLAKGFFDKMRGLFE